MWVGIESGVFENEKKEKVDAACIFLRWRTPVVQPFEEEEEEEEKESKKAKMEDEGEDNKKEKDKMEKGDKMEDEISEKIEEVVLWSDEIKIPENFEGGTNGEWSVHKDPHSLITEGKRSRADFIRDAILSWKKQNKEFENW